MLPEVNDCDRDNSSRLYFKTFKCFRLYVPKNQFATLQVFKKIWLLYCFYDLKKQQKQKHTKKSVVFATERPVKRTLGWLDWRWLELICIMFSSVRRKAFAVGIDHEPTTLSLFYCGSCNCKDTVTIYVYKDGNYVI